MRPSPIGRPATAWGRKRAASKVGDVTGFAPCRPSTFAVAAGYRLVVTSTFDMNNYHGFLRSKLPLGSFQPIQVRAIWPYGLYP